MYMHIDMYICVYMSTGYIRILHICTQVYVYIWMYVVMCIYPYVHAHMRIHKYGIYIDVYTVIHICMRIHICIYVHLWIHTYTCIYISRYCILCMYEHCIHMYTISVDIVRTCVYLCTIVCFTAYVEAHAHIIYRHTKYTTTKNQWKSSSASNHPWECLGSRYSITWSLCLL